ncbi:hypothetical protein Poli38472_000475 [Pythium oligandrum]|uniref:Integrase catalytic domain-containing protein n=1 Tax=Pythium oligandrum TaxID=41045 RepID=A0A8K1FJ63_PYTOL|nr:hypothetical protein Poli38472_014917 [Pythium oligandrum]TMW60433.1 hypothetical protein Poli38472_000475 [Pythium oligandrum]|eukprot:TMW54928.1 hypothetical protein Poli38472_014917 [Pythium oligandrum]
MVHLTAVKKSITAEESAALFLDHVFRLHGLPETLVSDRDTRFTPLFWRTLFKLLDTKLQMSTAAHPETDGQTERVNRVLEDVLRSYATSFGEWPSFLPLAEFAINKSVHVSTGLTPFYVNYGRHPRLPARMGVSTMSGGGAQSRSVLSSSAPPTSMTPKPVRRSKRLQAARRARNARQDDSYDEHYRDATRDELGVVAPPTTNDNIGDSSGRHGHLGDFGELYGDFGDFGDFGDSGGLGDTEMDGVVDEHDDEEMELHLSCDNNLATQLHESLSALLFAAATDNEDTRFNFEAAADLSTLSPKEEKSILDFVTKRESILRFVRDCVADAVDKQKEQADKRGRSNTFKFKVGDRVLLSTQNLPESAVTNLGSSKLLPRFIGPFRVTAKIGDAYTVDIASKMRLHPTFYVGRLKPHHSHLHHDQEPDHAPDRESSEAMHSDVPAAAMPEAPPAEVQCDHQCDGQAVAKPHGTAGAHGAQPLGEQLITQGLVHTLSRGRRRIRIVNPLFKLRDQQLVMQSHASLDVHVLTWTLRTNRTWRTNFLESTVLVAMAPALFLVVTLVTVAPALILLTRPLTIVILRPLVALAFPTPVLIVVFATMDVSRRSSCSIRGSTTSLGYRRQSTLGCR